MKVVVAMVATMGSQQVAMMVEKMAAMRVGKMAVLLSPGFELVQQLVLEKMMVVPSVCE